MKKRIGCCGIMRFVAMVLLVLCAGRAVAALVVWTGNGDGTNWFDGANWDAGQVPGDDDEVVIADGTILLTEETHVLALFTMTGGTLVFTNWNTRLRAHTVVIGDGATLTLPGPFTEAGPSNRVWIVCTDFTLEAGGVIDVDGKGYDVAHGPGSGASGGRRSGGGYGGWGAIGWREGRDSVSEGRPYGEPSGPLQPGSGGSRAEHGGAGGGLVQVEADGTIALHGIISAEGGMGDFVRHWPTGGGSGGGIYLSCVTFTGSANGVLRARGGGTASDLGDYGARGGGGRIAIHYADASPWPPVSIDVGRGEPGQDFKIGDLRDGSWGTLWLSDDSVLQTITDTIDVGVFPLNNLSLYIDGFSEWQRDQLSVTERAFTFGYTNFSLKVGGDLHVGSGGRLGAPRIEADSVRIEDGGMLEIRAVATNAVSDWGGWLTVNGDLRIGAHSTLRLISDAYQGGSPRVRVRHMIVEENGLIDAYGAGYFSAHGQGDGAGSTDHRRSGGGYGGQGGHGSNPDPGGQTYGSPFGPMFAGSGGCSLLRGGHGGGLVHVEASGDIMLYGRIDADGGLGAPVPHSGGGGGSGGGVFLVCRHLIGDTTSVISAQGGLGRARAGGGGGGRIAIWTGIPAQGFPILWQRLTEGKIPKAAVVRTAELPETWNGVFEEAIFLDGGPTDGGRGSDPLDPQPGEPGTYQWMTFYRGTLVMVR